MKETAEHSKQHYKATLADYLAACQGQELVVSAALCMTQTMCCAQALGLPWVPVLLGPTLPTGEVAHLPSNHAHQSPDPSMICALWFVAVVGDFPLWAISSKPLLFRWMNRATYSFLFWAL